MLTDTHAHLSFPELYDDLDNILQNAVSNGISKIINICIGRSSEEIGRAFGAGLKKEFIYNSVGFHPNHIDKLSIEDIDILAPYMKHDRCVAVGETGLDYYRNPRLKKKQKEFFNSLAELAIREGKPLIVHEREAFDDVVSILSEKNAFGKIPCIFHCFSGDAGKARKIERCGGYISVGGIITFKGAGELRKAVGEFPLERIMLETDCPFLAPEPKRGRRNEPSFVVYKASMLSSIKNLPQDETARITCETAVSVFSI
jgi:TatD DNase family protein